MKLKHTPVRIAAAVAVGLSLTLTACGGGDAKPAQSSAAPAPAKAPENKNATYASPFGAPAKVPADWNGAAGWSETEAGEVFALPHLLGYATDTKSGGDTKTVSSFRFYDSKGEFAGQSKAPDELDASADAISGKAVLTSVNGSWYLVYAQKGMSKVDPTSTKKSVPSMIVTVFDADGKETFRKVLELPDRSAQLDLQLGAPVIRSASSGTRTTQVVYVDSDSIGAPPPAKTPGARWDGRIDGEDVWYTAGTQGGTITVGTATVQVSKDYLTDRTAAKGRYLSVAHSDGRFNFANACDILDVHTGAPVTGSDKLGGACLLTQKQDGFLDTAADGFLTDNRTVAKDSPLSEYGMFLPESGAYYQIPNNISFQPVSVDFGGIFYGYSKASGGETKVASINVAGSGDDPKIVPDAERVPLAVSGGGTAAFSQRDVYNRSSALFFLTKK